MGIGGKVPVTLEAAPLWLFFRFMPPDDPLGRRGPTLSNFLSKKPRPPEPSWQHCPYGGYPGFVGSALKLATSALDQLPDAGEKCSSIFAAVCQQGCSKDERTPMKVGCRATLGGGYGPCVLQLLF